MTAHTPQLAGALAYEQVKLLACVHCGLCLEACPTYVHTGDENDSPRGRLYLMRAVAEGRLPQTSPAFSHHLERCLGCRACESACPAGVEYGQLLEAARDDLNALRTKRTFIQRLLGLVLRHVWLQPARLRLAFALTRVARDAGVPRLWLKFKFAHALAPRLAFALALLEGSSASLPSDEATTADEATTDATVHSRSATPIEATDPLPTMTTASALLFTGCVTEGLFARVNQATRRVLETNHCVSETPPAQGCCGALHAHAGDLAGARTLARRNLDAFDDGTNARPIVTNAGGCGAMLASYSHLLQDDPVYATRACDFSARVRDVSQHLAAIGLRSGAPLADGSANTGTTYDASCHLLHGQHAEREPLEVLRAVPDLKLVPLVDADVCCGGAGVYNLLEPALSARVLAEKLARVAATGAGVLATGNPGCHMQLAAGARFAKMNLRICHPIELLDESYRRAGFYDPDDGFGLQAST